MLKRFTELIHHRLALRAARRLAAQGRLKRAIATLEQHDQSLRVSPRATDPSILFARAVCLGQLSAFHHTAGDEMRARVYAQSALNLCLVCSDLSGVRTYATNLLNIHRDDAEGARWAALIRAAEIATQVEDLPALVNQIGGTFLEQNKVGRYVACMRLAQELACLVLGGLDPARPEAIVNTEAAAALGDINYSPWTVEVRERAEGYREYWCTPGHWTCTGAAQLDLLVAESLSGYVDVKRDFDFWSASDAALRLTALPPLDLGTRELAIMATRRSTDYRRPTPWAAAAQTEALSASWSAAADPHVHWVETSSSRQTRTLWHHYGMSALPLSQADTYSVSTGVGIRNGLRSAKVHEPWHGGAGTYYAWPTLAEWTHWPRRQEAASTSTTADEGALLLFVSHRWESIDHPDPTGRQLLALKAGLSIALAAALRIEPGAESASGLPEVVRRFLVKVLPDALTNPALELWAEQVAQAAHEHDSEEAFWQRLREIEDGPLAEPLGGIRHRMLIWYDYASMDQTPRSAAEEQAFRAELTLLNSIQGGAVTVVLATDKEYESRAWCFLEICGGIRARIVELTPSWGRQTSIAQALNRWAHISDQVIASIQTSGPDTLAGTNLRATDPRDLAIVATLIGQLPLFGLVESDGSDLVGGSIPMPFRAGRWIVDGAADAPVVTRLNVAARDDFGRLPDNSQVRDALRTAAGADRLDGACGVWFYTSQRLLSLAWASQMSALIADLSAALPIGTPSSVACTWADSRSLGDDGSAWTRYIPSSVEMLVVITQADVPAICRLYESVVRAHLAAGVVVVTYTPDTGAITIGRSPLQSEPSPGLVANALVVRRVRRTTVTPDHLLLAPDLAPEQVDAMAALRLDPADQGLNQIAVAHDSLEHLSRRRVLAEAMARTTVSCWEAMANECFTPAGWSNADEAVAQIAAIERLVALVQPAADNPLSRRAALYQALYGEQQREAPLTFDLPEPPPRAAGMSSPAD